MRRGLARACLALTVREVSQQDSSAPRVCGQEVGALMSRGCGAAAPRERSVWKGERSLGGGGCSTVGCFDSRASAGGRKPVRNGLALVGKMIG